MPAKHPTASAGRGYRVTVSSDERRQTSCFARSSVDEQNHRRSRTPIIREGTSMTATKAIAGGVAANIVTIVLWMISSIPGWSSVPEEPRAAIIALVSAGIGAPIVYYPPPNKETLPVKSTERSRETVGVFEAGRVAA